jgi:hypothetical protein
MSVALNSITLFLVHRTLPAMAMNGFNLDDVRGDS